ncbi:MAG TPA: DNA repair protein RadA [Kofleriaceae bacterium]|jgi:DNA repair protein RadA/Sms|nr:DNA repair protein RadA [Kofleriaceae bacterium]
MAKVKALPRSRHVCQACGHVETKWLGRCPACHEWNSLVEEFADAVALAPRPSAVGVSTGDGPQPIDRISEVGGVRRPAGIAELDRVLGGGFVAGSAVLLGGDPGIGKSTLLVQALAGLARQGPVLYATGEESVAQTAMRARRVNAAVSALALVAETDVEKIIAHARASKPTVLAVDSIQTVYTPLLDSIPGSLAQVRECASRLTQFAKTTGTPTVLVGHVTKDGGLAGPKTLEHLVDVVLQLEGDAGPYRVLRAHKNRFGSTQEIGVFEMRGGGLVEVANPSAHLLAERPIGAPGSVVVASADGVRPLLVEIQALVAPASAGFARRTAAGVDGNRVSLLLAVLAQRAACDVLDRDVFVNVAGGLRLAEPAIDLGVACAIHSSARGRAIDAHTVVFGEIGLAGEIRAVTLCEHRLAEAARLGFKRALIPAQNAKLLGARDHAGLDLVSVDRLTTAFGAL